MHIVVAATHCFDKTVTETVIQENLNPIEQAACLGQVIILEIHPLTSFNFSGWFLECFGERELINGEVDSDTYSIKFEVRNDVLLK